MRISALKELLLYRYRYILGYIVLIGLGIALTTWQLGGIPPGFSQGETASAVLSSQLSLSAESFVNLPYQVLQFLSLELFGPTILGIRLPSILLAIMVAFSAYFLLRRWFGESMAVMGTVLVITSVHFLLRGRTGTPLILHSLWPLLLLLSASMVSIQKKNWRKWLLLFVASAALALYTPFMLIILLIFAAIILLSRRGRVILSDVGGPFWTTCAFVFIILLLPLGWNLYQHPGVLSSYLGLTDAPTFQLVVDRFKEFIQTMGDIRPHESLVLTPILSLPAIGLGLWGATYAICHAARARYAVLLAWLLVSIALFVSVNELSIAIVFVPTSLLVILGFWRFVRRWYDIFPRNPYARLAAIAPIALVLLVLVQFNFERYFYGVARAENVRTLYDNDAITLQKKIRTQPLLQSATIVIEAERQPFFSLMTKKYPGLKVVTHATLGAESANGPIIITDSELARLNETQKTLVANKSVRYVVDERPENAVRFIVFR